MLNGWYGTIDAASRSQILAPLNSAGSLTVTRTHPLRLFPCHEPIAADVCQACHRALEEACLDTTAFTCLLSTVQGRQDARKRIVAGQDVDDGNADFRWFAMFPW